MSLVDLYIKEHGRSPGGNVADEMDRWLYSVIEERQAESAKIWCRERGHRRAARRGDPCSCDKYTATEILEHQDEQDD